jgi:hypothetical protein
VCEIFNGLKMIHTRSFLLGKSKSTDYTEAVQKMLALW